jgi:hypothetical protein
MGYSEAIYRYEEHLATTAFAIARNKQRCEEQCSREMRSFALASDVPLARLMWKHLWRRLRVAVSEERLQAERCLLNGHTDDCGHEWSRQPIGVMCGGCGESGDTEEEMVTRCKCDRFSRPS